MTASIGASQHTRGGFYGSGWLNHWTLSWAGGRWLDLRGRAQPGHGRGQRRREGSALYLLRRPAGAAPTASSTQLAQQLVQLEELKARGTLSEVAFQEARGRLLGTKPVGDLSKSYVEHRISLHGGSTLPVWPGCSSCWLGQPAAVRAPEGRGDPRSRIESVQVISKRRQHLYSLICPVGPVESDPASRLRLALEMMGAGLEMKRLSLQRAYPQEGPESIAARLASWVQNQPIAPGLSLRPLS
ncbi:MAG: hypothetical protein U0931_41340 [Vulcanimicrobiota bacterium]